MGMEATTYLTGIGILLILGVLASVIAKKLRVSNVLILVLLGIALGNMPLGNYGMFSFPGEFMVGLALLTLAMIVFDGTSRLSFHTVDKHTNKALEMVIVYACVNVVLLGAATLLLFLDTSLSGVVLALIFAVVMTGTDPGSVFVMLGNVKHRVFDFLRIEAVFNTPVVVIFPFLFLDLLNAGGATFSSFLSDFLLQIVVGVGAGILIGIVVFRVMRRYYSETLSPVAIIAAAILAYVFAEALGGNGVLSVATLGLVFGNTYVKHRGELIEFSSLFTLSLEILIFLLIGLLVTFDFSLAFFLKSLLLFAIAVVARYVAVVITLHRADYSWREKLFMSLNTPKGIAVAVVTLTLFVFDGSTELITLMILFVVYSLATSSIADRFGPYFIGKEVKQ